VGWIACHHVSVLAIQAVDVWFPAGPHVLHAIDLVVEAGEHWALLGANGAGKSTLLALAGAQRFPSRGTVDVLGRRLGRVDLRELRRAIGTVDARLRMPAELSLRAYVTTGLTQTVQPLADCPRSPTGRYPCVHKGKGPGPGSPAPWYPDRRCSCSTNRPRDSTSRAERTSSALSRPPPLMTPGWPA
jgi:iron complex transport system ATP-binding protein